MASVLVDTGVWYSLCDSKDSCVTRDRIDDIYNRIRVHKIIVPWPVAYETLRTSFVRKPIALTRFERELKGNNIVLLDDTPYRQAAFELSVESSLRRKRPLSMVDCVLRLLLDDIETKIDFLVTFNPKDFYDVCTRQKIEMLN